MDLQKGLEAMTDVNESFKLQREMLKKEYWHYAVALKNCPNATWPDLQTAFQPDENTRRRLLYYRYVATQYFPSEDVDVLAKATADTPRYSKRDYTGTDETVMFSGKSLASMCLTETAEGRRFRTPLWTSRGALDVWSALRNRSPRRNLPCLTVLTKHRTGVGLELPTSILDCLAVRVERARRLQHAKQARVPLQWPFRLTATFSNCNTGSDRASTGKVASRQLR